MYTEEAAQALFTGEAAQALFMEVAIVVEEQSILVEADQAEAGVLEVEAGVPVVLHIPEVPHILVDHQDGRVVELVAAQSLEAVELLLLEVVEPQSLEEVVVFIEEVELVATIHLVDQDLQAAHLLTVPHQAAPQALHHTVVAGSIFIVSVKVLCLFAWTTISAELIVLAIHVLGTLIIKNNVETLTLKHS